MVSSAIAAVQAEEKVVRQRISLKKAESAAETAMLGMVSNLSFVCPGSSADLTKKIGIAIKAVADGAKEDVVADSDSAVSASTSAGTQWVGASNARYRMIG